MASRPVDYKKFGLRRVLRPFVQGGLSSTVLIDGGGYVNVGFSVALVRRAGMVLPRGVSPMDPAFMTLKYNIKTEQYLLYVQYLKSAEQFPLLVIPERPEWLRLSKSVPIAAPTKRVTRMKELS
jgi:hypothetical protein